MAGQPRPTFFLALALVVIGLVAYGVYNLQKGGEPPAGPKGGQQANGKNGGDNQGGDEGDPGTGSGPIVGEKHDEIGPTVPTPYHANLAAKLPEVKGTAAYHPMDDNTVRFALNVWAGWGPIILANDGFKAAKVWKTPDGKDFKLELVLIDNPIAMQDTFVSGDVHIGWATLDMVPLFLQRIVDRTGKPSDERVMPRIYQQIDWSNGGDGIVARKGIKTVADLRGKQVALAENSPSHYFLLSMLANEGVQPGEVKMIPTDDAFAAADAFSSDQGISAAVSWAPKIYELKDIPGNRMLVTTQTANKLIADVWFARADFARDNPGICEALVRGIFDAMEELKDPARKQRCAQLMAEGYNIPASETANMFSDAHSTNWAENHEFFQIQNNPANFEMVWRNAYSLYRAVGVINHSPVSFDQVMDATLIAKLGKEPQYANTRSDYDPVFTPKSAGQIVAESPEVLTKRVTIHFFPNNWDLFKKVTKEVSKMVNGEEVKETVEELYDPSVDAVLEDIARLAGTFGAARIVISGHTDSSMKGQVDAELVKELSLNRANAVKEALVRKFKLNPNQFSVKGEGWDRPVDHADPSDPDYHSKNRRVEIKVLSAEQS